MYMLASLCRCCIDLFVPLRDFSCYQILRNITQLPKAATISDDIETNRVDIRAEERLTPSESEADDMGKVSADPTTVELGMR